MSSTVDIVSPYLRRSPSAGRERRGSMSQNGNKFKAQLSVPNSGPEAKGCRLLLVSHSVTGQCGEVVSRVGDLPEVRPGGLTTKSLESGGGRSRNDPGCTDLIPFE